MKDKTANSIILATCIVVTNISIVWSYDYAHQARLEKGPVDGKQKE